MLGSHSNILESLQNVCMEKKSQHWLEPKNGVGLSLLRGRNVRGSTGCLLCGSNVAVCLGQACMGRKPGTTRSVPDSTGVHHKRGKLLPGYASQDVGKKQATLLERQYTCAPRRRIAAYKFPCQFFNRDAAADKTSLVGKSKSQVLPFSLSLK